MPTGSHLTSEKRSLGNMTVDQVIKHDRTLAVSCDPCRVIREFRDLSVIAAKRPGQPIRTMKFRCTKCQTLGAPHVSGWEGGDRVRWG